MPNRRYPGSQPFTAPMIQVPQFQALSHTVILSLNDARKYIDDWSNSITKTLAQFSLHYSKLQAEAYQQETVLIVKIENPDEGYEHKGHLVRKLHKETLEHCDAINYLPVQLAEYAYTMNHNIYVLGVLIPLLPQDTPLEANAHGEIQQKLKDLKALWKDRKPLVYDILCKI